MEVKDIDNAKSTHLKTLEETRNKIQLYTKQESAIKENLEYEQKMKEVKAKANKVKDKENQIDEEYTKLQVQIAMLNNKVSECNINLEKIKEYQKSKRLYQYYLESIHRDGIPHNLISQTLPQIQDEVNSILSQLVDFKVILNADHKNINGYIAYSEDRYWGIELVSGMEKFITSLAIRCALISVSSLPRPNFILIDEGFGALDKDNLGSVISLFEYLKSQFQFTAIISHIESMRDMVDSIIEITKKSGISQIQHK
jgi:DNA repair exonuclease SbcCD ATPase subunit